MQRSLFGLGPLAALVVGLAVAVHAEDDGRWREKQLAKLSGRWTTVRENAKAKAEKDRTSRVELVFAENELRVQMYRLNEVRAYWGDKLKIAGVEQIKGSPFGLLGRFQVEVATSSRKDEVYFDFVNEKLVLFGRVMARPWEGFALSGEYQRSGQPEPSEPPPKSTPKSSPKSIPQLAAAQTKDGPLPIVPADFYVDANNTGVEDGGAAHPFKTVQQAIDAAKPGGAIAVAGGVYPQNIKVQAKAVGLYGGYSRDFKKRDPAANPSHLKGDGNDSVVTLYEAGASVVDGFLITGGVRSLMTAPLFQGGGFFIYQGSPTIANNVIEKNVMCPPDKQDETKFGGGIYATGSSLTLLNNVIRNNVAGCGAGIYVSSGPKLVIRGNTIQNNIGVSNHGGGAWLDSRNAEISRNRIMGNEIGRDMGYGWGGGMIVVNAGGRYRLSNNILSGNYAPSLGAGFFADEGAEASMDHDLVYGNKTKPDGEGAAVYVDGNENGVGSSLTLNHVTIVDNTSAPMVKGGAVKATWNSKLVVKNCILWNNGGDDVEADEKSTATVTYTLSQEAIEGTGNLSKDPLFVNAAGQDYRLRSDSPAVGAAAPAKNGGRPNLGVEFNIAKTNTGGIAKDVEKDAGAGEKASKTYLLRGTTGELPSEVGDDNTKMAKVKSPEFGGTAVEIGLIDSFGQKVAKVADWTPFDALCLDVVNNGEKELPVEFNLFHAGTTNFGTRVVTPFVLKPGKNEVRIAVNDLKNNNGTPAKLSEVRRWYVASETPVTLLVGDFYLEGRAGGEGKAASGGASPVKTDPARLARIKAARMPEFAEPIPYNTPEADAIMSAAEIFPPDNPWNTLIEDWPVHPNSKAIVASIGAAKPLRYNQDMAFVIVPPDQKKVDVKITEFPDESDPGPYPVAENTPIEGWPASFQQDPKLKALTLDDVQRGKPDLEQDRHGIVFDPAARKLYEFYKLTKTDAGWRADGAAIFDLSSNKLRPDGWTSADAAGLPILPAIVRYDEIKRGVIDHALRFTVVRSRRAYVYPATHFASKLTDENLPRMGERFRLRKDFDTSKFSPEARVILEALKRYGMFMADNGMDWGLSVSGDERLPSFHDEFRRVKGSDFEVVTPPPSYVAP